MSECEGPGGEELGEGYHWARAMGAAFLVEGEVSMGEKRGATVVVLLDEVVATGVNTHLGRDNGAVGIRLLDALGKG